MNNKPKAKLIGENGNIFNLISIAAKVLNNAGMSNFAEEMCDRCMSSKSYVEAISIIQEYVEVI